MIQTNTIFKIRPAVQDYAWGMPWNESLAAKLGRVPESEGPFAEVWYGAHSNGPARSVDGRSLAELVEENSQGILGSSKTLYGVFPFMAKVLSVHQALSIQLHPQILDAKRLHEVRPEHYPDENPKDEASVALTDVELLYGMKSLDEMLEAVCSLPMLSEYIWDGIKTARSAKGPKEESARELFKAIWSLEKQVVAAACKRLYRELQEKPENTRSKADKWVIKLAKYYPEGDVGMFGFYLMDLLELRAGQGVSIPCGVPHAYLSGQLLELMKPSDNVIRCGLTPKYRDDEELIRCAMFAPLSAPVINGVEQESGSLSYRNYNLGGNFEIDFFSSAGSSSFASEDSPEILLSIDAEGTLSAENSTTEISFSAADAFVVPANCKGYELELDAGSFARFRLPPSPTA